MWNLIDGNKIAGEIRTNLKAEVEKLRTVGVQPGLAVILVGNDSASETYVRYKEKACQKNGLYSEVIRLPHTITEEELIAKVQDLNQRDEIDGILVQLPLPNHIRDQVVIDHISEKKDVDGFTPRNVGNLVISNGGLYPCTPLGIIELIKRTGTEIVGKHAVVVGRSNIVGKPVAMLLLHENATVTICHSHTDNLSEITKQADILVVAIGKAHYIGPEHVKPGAIVIDVGMNRLDNGKLTGDVDYERVKEMTSYITPVPKGVGPMTITMLLHNTIQAARRRSPNG